MTFQQSISNGGGDIQWMKPAPDSKAPFVYLTVYPDNLYPDEGYYTKLANELKDFNKDILFRLMPEFTGDWFPKYYDEHGTTFVAAWRKVHTVMKGVLGDKISFVWSPNHMDSNTPSDYFDKWWPGDEFVEVIGTSIYWYGNPKDQNSMPPDGVFEESLNGGDLYHKYSVLKSKPMMISESAPTWHPEKNQDVDHLKLKQAFWRQYLTNPAFLDKYSNLKHICMFEIQKWEDGELRDFRLGNNENVRNEFLQDYKQVADRYVTIDGVHLSGTDNVTSAHSSSNNTSVPSNSSYPSTASTPSNSPTAVSKPKKCKRRLRK